MVNKEYLDRVISVCEDEGWSVYTQDDGTIYLSQYSPAGEDFGFEVNADRIVDDITEYYESFDVEDHVEFWVEQKIEAKRTGMGSSSVPSVFRLCEDAKAIEDMLARLIWRVSGVEG